MPVERSLLIILPAWNELETVAAVIAEVNATVPEADVLVNFSSSRSVYSSTLDTFNYPQVCPRPLSLLESLC